MDSQRITIHTPVLLHEVIQGVHVQAGDVVLDATLGGGGYTRGLCEAVGESGTVIALDQDAEALQRFNADFSDTCHCRLTLERANFRNLDEVLERQAIKALDGIVFDLGLSSDQLEQSGRGFSFQKDEPLDMRMHANSETSLTAQEIVNTWAEESIADILYGYGGERYARRIAKALVKTREHQHITETHQLVAIIKDAVPTAYKNGKIHPATKTFQALRITVNDELGALQDGLEKGYGALRKGGRMVVVSFHSLEDRIVKTFFREQEAHGSQRITKKPLVPTDDEIQQNPRSRSAKLRILEK